MHENTGLADLVDYDDVMNGNLCTFHNSAKDTVQLHTVPDNMDYVEFLKTHLGPSCHSKIIFYATEILRQYMAWYKHFPNIQVFYAVKCNPNPLLMDLMVTLPGICFDCASTVEVDLCLSRGITPDRICYANPTKSKESIEYMAEKSIWCGTLDCKEEVEKIHSILGDRASNCRVIIRLAVDDKNSIVALSSKYGAFKDEIPGIMETCKKYNMQVVGVAFHVGSGNVNVEAYRNALRDTKEVFDLGKQYGFTMNIVDFGGGWSGELSDHELNNPNLATLSASISAALDEFGFNSIQDIKYMSEPGRYFNNNVIDIACYVTCAHERNGRRFYVINEGVMGIFKDLILTSELPFEIVPLKDGECVPTTIVGPSGHSIDIICNDCMLPRLEVGDPILFRNLGAYTVSLTTLPLRNNQDICFLIRESSLKSM